MDGKKSLVSADAGDFHFELHKKPQGGYACLRSDLSDPAGPAEEITDLNEIPKPVFDIFNKAMC